MYALISLNFFFVPQPSRVFWFCIIQINFSEIYENYKKKCFNRPFETVNLSHFFSLGSYCPLKNVSKDSKLFVIRWPSERCLVMVSNCVNTQQSTKYSIVSYQNLKYLINKRSILIVCMAMCYVCLLFIKYENHFISISYER